MRISTVGDLKRMLDELPDEMELLAVHQPQWPLREVIGGVWVDDGRPDEEDCECDPDEMSKDDACAICGYGPAEHVSGELDHQYDGDGGRNPNCPVHGDQEKVAEVAYLVLNGHPYDGTPYGSKRAWEAV